MPLLLPLPRSPSPCEVTHSSPTNPALPFSVQTNLQTPADLNSGCHTRGYPQPSHCSFFQVLSSSHLLGHSQQLGTHLNHSTSGSHRLTVSQAWVSSFLHITLSAQHPEGWVSVTSTSQMINKLTILHMQFAHSIVSKDITKKNVLGGWVQ